MIKEGTKAPDFNLPASTGGTIGLKDLKGKTAVIFFYPKDDTSGCTVEACGFRDGYQEILKTGAVLLGVSPDSPKSHDKFIAKFNLPFPLLSDEEKTMCQAYGVWVEKSMYGRKYMGVARTTVIIGKDGTILKVFEKVRPEGHSTEVLTALTEVHSP